MSDNIPGGSGLTEEQAKEFHRYYMRGLTAFLIVAALAHLIVWNYRPWFPGAGG